MIAREASPFPIKPSHQTESGGFPDQDLNPEQRHHLRVVLLSLGILLSPSSENVTSDTQTEASEPVEQTTQVQEVSKEIPVSRFLKEVGEIKISDYDLNFTNTYATRPVVGAEEYTRAEYVSQAIQFTDWDEGTKSGVPPVVQDTLRDILPGLCAQETRFDASRESEVGAKGIFQFMRETWLQYGGVLGQERSLKAQVEVAGRFFSDIYRQLMVRIDESKIERLRSKFATEEDFLVTLIVPLMINSYHSGTGRMVEAVESYVDVTSNEEMSEGHDLYLAIADFAHVSDEGYLEDYRDASRAYTSGVYAFAEKLKKDNGAAGQG